jgi:hypothetical protein
MLLLLMLIYSSTALRVSLSLAFPLWRRGLRTRLHDNMLRYGLVRLRHTHTTHHPSTTEHRPCHSQHPYSDLVAPTAAHCGSLPNFAQ